MLNIKHSELASAARNGLLPRVIGGRAQTATAPTPDKPLVKETSIADEIKATKTRLDKAETDIANKQDKKKP